MMKNWVILFSLFLFGCHQSNLTGVWYIAQVNLDNYKPISALPGNNIEFQLPEYDSSLQNSKAFIFYQAKELGAKVEFHSSNILNTTLFYSNFGKKLFDYNPESSRLVFKFIHSKDYPDMPSNQEIYAGIWDFKNDSTAIWKLDNGKILTLRKE